MPDNLKSAVCKTHGIAGSRGFNGVVNPNIRNLIFGLMLITATTFAAAQQEQESLRFARQRTKSSEGTEFYLCFQRNYKESKESQRDTKKELTLELFITSGQDADVEVECKGIGFKRTIHVPAGTVVQVSIDPAAQVTEVESIRQLAVHLTSRVPVAVYGLNRRFQTTDTFLGLPVSVLGTEYRAVGYQYSEGLMSQFAVVATENGTEVSITPTASTSGKRPPALPFTVQMQAGDVYQVGGDPDDKGLGDLTGSLIKSNKRIAVFSGHQCAYVPNPNIGCNFLVEQLPPVSAWGKDFYVGLLKGRARHTVRVIAAVSDTKVFENSALVATLNAGQFYENSNVRQNIRITADQAVLVAQYSQGFTNGDSIGDPMMMLISPTQQFLSEYRFATPISGEWNHYINIIIPTNAVSSLWLDDQRIDAAIFQPIAPGRYSIGRIRVEFGSHTIKADEAFGLSSYGFGYNGQAYDAYGNLGGQAFFDDYSAPAAVPPSK